MLRQQLQETNETLAARNAEVQELKTRVADLEKLQQQQQQLLTMKDSELAAAQQNLAASNRPAAQPPATAQTQQPTPATTEHADRGGSIWVWAGLALIVASLLAWWLSRRSRPAPTPMRGFDTAALAASIPTADADDHDVHERDVDGRDIDDRDVDDGDVYAGVDADADMETDADAIDIAEPVAPPVTAATWTAPSAAMPTWHAGTAVATAAEPIAADAANASQQLELARAYLDLGDDNAARELLREVLDGRDPAARTEAARLLRDL